MERLSHNHTEDTSELLSAYSDDALDVLERRRAEAQVQSCAACAQELRDLRMFKTLLRELPAAQPRRSFTLDPATAVGPRRLLFPMLRLATMAASLLFFVVLGADLLNVGGIGSQGDAATFSTKEAPAARQLDSGTGAADSEMAEAYGAASAAPSIAALVAPPAPESDAAGSAASAVPEAMADATLPSTETAVAAANAAPPQAAAPVEPSVVSQSADQSQPVDGQDTAGGMQPLQANEPSSPDTTEIQQMEDAEEAQNPALSTLQIAEIGLALIALALAAGALWAWRQQR